MSIVVELKKKLDIQLEKKGIRDGIITRVGFLLDTSGSMKSDYRRGSMDRLNERLLPVAMRFDDNASMEVYAFSSDAHKLPDMNEGNYQGYVRKHILKNWGNLCGGTYYGKGLNAFRKEWSDEVAEEESSGLIGKLKTAIFGKPEEDKPASPADKEKPAPGFIIMQTDGDNHDPSETALAISRLREENIFVCMIGTGDEVDMDRLEGYAKMSNNVSTFRIENLDSFTDEELYENILSEKAVAWLKSL